MTPKQHATQRDMVTRSLLLAPSSKDRGEERPRKPRAPAAPVAAPAVAGDSGVHSYRLPVVTEARLL